MPKVKGKTPQEIAEFLKSMGIDPNTVLPKEADSTPAAKEMATLSAEMTLRSLKWPLQQKAHRRCEECKKTFASDYTGVAYCSDTCRSTALAYYGMDWTNKPAKERYGGRQPPGIIPPDAIAAMTGLLRSIGLEVIDQGNREPVEQVPIEVPNYELKHQKTLNDPPVEQIEKPVVVDSDESLFDLF